VKDSEISQREGLDESDMVVLLHDKNDQKKTKYILTGTIR